MSRDLEIFLSFNSNHNLRLQSPPLRFIIPTEVFTMKLGYTDFINKHKTLFFSLFIAFFLMYFVIPIVFIDLSKYDNLSVRDDTLFTFAPIYLCIRCFNTTKMISSRYDELSPFIDRSYKEFYATTLKNYADGIIGMIFAILILASIIYLIIRYIKTKSISRLGVCSHQNT